MTLPGVTLVTIGVYGFSEEEFCARLRGHKVDALCDVRRRRGVRGADYAFANSLRLQRRLAEMGIRYFHCKELSPSETTRNLQRAHDKQERIAKRQRSTLSQCFIDAYSEECLATFDARQFLVELGEDIRVVALLCVEQNAEACHRFLLAGRIARELKIPVTHIRP